MLRNSTSRSLLTVVALAVWLGGCSTSQFREDFNTGRGAWNAPEYVYQPAHIKRKYARAVKVMNSGKDEKAAEAFEKFIDKYPGYPGAHVNLAIIYERLGRTEDALGMLDESMEIIPEYPLALNQLGLIKRKQGDFSGAEDAWQRAAKEDKTYPSPRYNLGVLYDLYLQDMPAALAAYKDYQDVLYRNANEAQPKGEFYRDLPPVDLIQDKEVQRWMTDLERRIGTARSAQATEAL